MKIHEAIAMLEQMDPNKECTVTFGNSSKQKPDDTVPYYVTMPNYPAQPQWVIGKEYWPNRNDITCKMH